MNEINTDYEVRYYEFYCVRNTTPPHRRNKGVSMLKPARSLKWAALYSCCLPCAFSAQSCVGLCQVHPTRTVKFVSTTATTTTTPKQISLNL